MKLEDFSYNLVIKTFELLEKEYHYKIADDTRKKVAAKIQENLTTLINEERK